MPARALKELLIWPAGGGGLAIAVTRHPSLIQGHTPGPLPDPEGREM